MSRRPRSLSKQDVEQMMDAVAGPSSSVLEEITVVCAALRVALAKALTPTSDDPNASLLISGSGDTAQDGPEFGLSDDWVSDLEHPSWRDLVTAAAAQGRWSPQRRLLLVRAARPDQAPDPEAVLDALWDLVQELNELRTIAPPR